MTSFAPADRAPAGWICCWVCRRYRPPEYLDPETRRCRNPCWIAAVTEWVRHHDRELPSAWKWTHRTPWNQVRWDTLIGIPIHDLPSRTRQPKRYAAVCLLYELGWESTPALWTVEGRHGWTIPANVIVKIAAERDISERTLDEAKRICLVESRRLGFGRGSRVAWLPPRRQFIRWVRARPELERLRQSARRPSRGSEAPTAAASGSLSH